MVKETSGTYPARGAGKVTEGGVYRMKGKGLFAAVLVSMLLLAAFGVWAMVDSAIAYRSRPKLNVRPQGQIITRLPHDSNLGGNDL